ncbi:SDR family NAD(P)-dependent oxidoreductase [Aureisphaera galaxeae]|uniref:SDR family NAD(P)-dependent oxidoreductase n=1 Tax=Aureisphaera galaxeae TaxID=1538023 RepID=UPI0023503E47|nr:SDR family NAD(P)-dependent oxidoreductase [Aureisphaera galaxeae]MDC8002703.1 SDR family NAD(P)-dependent oxidoreductase [Aureisphaera galaxeae]
MEKTMLITGSNRGTGYGIAQYFHNKGFRIVSLNKTLKEEPWLGEIECDLSKREDVIAACKLISHNHNRIDVCVLNAAIRRLSYIEELSETDWEDSVSTNYSSIFYMLKYLLPLFKVSNTYTIVMGSHAGSHYFEGGAAYCSTKAALKALVEVFIQETREYGMRTTFINAGAINNRPKGNEDKKMQPESIARFLFDLVHSNPEIIFGEIELRPALPLKSNEQGISKLQYI